MDRIKGLREYVKRAEFREAMGLPGVVCEEYRLLAQGEYNMNYIFTHPVSGREFLLRVNCGSQMHLENQIEYEYHALELLKDSGRTPKVFYVDGSLKDLGHGVLVMEYLPGKSLDYRKDMGIAAQCLADIHSVPVPADDGLLSPEDPLRAILNECEEMVKVYMDSSLGDGETKSAVRELLDRGCTPEQILEELLGDTGLEITDTIPARFYCNCSKERVEKAVASIGREDIQEMIGEGKDIEVKCHFCNSAYTYTVEDLRRIMHGGKR